MASRLRTYKKKSRIETSSPSTAPAKGMFEPRPFVVPSSKAASSQQKPDLNKVHTDTQSDRLNRSIQARAFTTGQDVFFRQGAYHPGDRGGQELIAHELTHVVQQEAGRGGKLVQRAPSLEDSKKHLPEYPEKPNRVFYADSHGVAHKEPEQKQQGPFYVAPHEFKLRGQQRPGHPPQVASTADYETEIHESKKAERAKELGLSDPTKLPKEEIDKLDKQKETHYMSGLTFKEKEGKAMMNLEQNEEGVQGHSLGYFESKYTDHQRSNYNPATDYGKTDSHGNFIDPTGQGTDQVYSAGRHNPYISKTNLQHRLTHGVLADNALGANTSNSSKFLSYKHYQEAFDKAKQAVANGIISGTLPKDTKTGKYYKQYTVKIEHGKPMGKGFEGDSTSKIQNHVTDLFGNTTAGVSGKKGKPPNKYPTVNKVSHSDITASQTGVTLKSISPIEFEAAPSQHYPAKTLSQPLYITPFGTAMF